MINNAIKKLTNRCIITTLLCCCIITTAQAGFWEEHVYFGKVVQDGMKKYVDTGNPWIDTPARWAAMAGSHIVIDRVWGEKGSSVAIDSTVVGVATMFFFTPDDQKWDLIENFIFTCWVPDVLFKAAFHSHGLDPLITLDRDQSEMVSKTAIMFYSMRLNF